MWSGTTRPRESWSVLQISLSSVTVINTHNVHKRQNCTFVRFGTAISIWYSAKNEDVSEEWKCTFVCFIISVWCWFTADWSTDLSQWCGLRLWVLGQDLRPKNSVLVLCAVVLVLQVWCCTRSCYARRYNDLEGHSNFSSTINSFSILCSEHHYCGDQLWRLLTSKLNSSSAFVYFRGLGLGLLLKNLVLFTSLLITASKANEIITE